MKYVILLLIALSFAAGVLGFTLLPGTIALVFRIAFVVLLVTAGAVFFIPKKEPKMLRSTFADSFRSELPPS